MLSQYKEIEIDYRQGAPLSPAEMKKAVKDADAMIAVIPDKIDENIIKTGKNLQIIAAYSVGYDHIDVETATKKKIYVSNTPGDLTESVAEHAFTLMMSLARRVVEGDKYCRAKKYKYWDPMLYIGPQMKNKTLGIIGFGRIGQQMARLCRNGLEMQILYTDVNQKFDAENLLDAKKVDLDTLLNESDVISIHCNLCDETHHMIDTKELEKMKPLSLIINTARGPVIDEGALARALKEGWVAGAALDVFENEPNIHPDLLKLDNVILTPHIASATYEARIQMARMAVQNVIDVLINKTAPRNLVNKELQKESVHSIV